MSQRTENSVLTSLKDLKGIESDRQQREQDERRQREVTERQEREAAEARAREREEQSRRDASEAQRRAEESRQREEREGQLRLQEAERRARVEADARLETERMKLELEVRSQRPADTRYLVPIILGLVIAVVGGVGYLFGFYLPRQDQRRREESQAREARMRTEAETERKTLLGRLSQKEADLQKAIASSMDQQQLQALRKQLEDIQQQQQVVAQKTPMGAGKGKGGGGKGGGMGSATGPTTQPPPMGITDDCRGNPLCGIH
jgi:hypothetical protein